MDSIHCDRYALFLIIGMAAQNKSSRTLNARDGFHRHDNGDEARIVVFVLNVAVKTNASNGL
jgi:hypothetical protein